MSVMMLPEPSGSIYPPGGVNATSPPVGVSSWLRRFGGKLVAIVREAVIENRVRRAARELQRLDDYMLRDIGISRSEIHRVVRYGREADSKVLRVAFGLDEPRLR